MLYALVALCWILFCVQTPLFPHDLIDITKIDSNILLDIKYATADNFAHKAVYSKAKCYLLKPVAEKLSQAAKEFAKRGLYIKIWDGYRPHKIQFKFWELLQDERYVENPYNSKKGSRHNRGCAIDLTLIDGGGKELDMGTEFDNFTQKAHIDCKDFGEQVLENRKLLISVMHAHGFKVLVTEWWHFDFIGWEKYPLLDISFDELE